MKKYAFILWVALTMTSVFTACTDNDSPMSEQTAKKPVTIRATIDGDLGSRVALTDDAENRVVKVDWAEGDAFKIKVNEKDYTFVYSKSTEEFAYDNQNGDFPATFISAGTVTATYPATTPGEYTNQSGTLENAATLLTMTATLDVTEGQSTEDLALNFKHNNSIVKMTLKNDVFKEKSVTGVTLKSENTEVATATNTFTGNAENGSIVAYFAVAPQEMTDISIHAVCEGSNYVTTLNDNTLGIGKLYNVNKTLVGLKTAEQAVKGDLAMADGTFVSKDDIDYLTDALKGNVKGIVFWTEKDEGTSTLVGDNVADKIMQTEFPNYTHGLIVSLKDVSQDITKWQSTCTKIAQWQNENSPYNESDYKSIASGTAATDLINNILGYQNTKILKAYNASLESGSANMVLPVSLLDDFSNQNSAPANTTGWFIPSAKELHMLCYKDVANVWDAYDNAYTDTKVIVNASLEKVGGTKFGSSYYWSSSESADNERNAFRVGFNSASINRYSKSNTCRVRAVCAY